MRLGFRSIVQARAIRDVALRFVSAGVSHRPAWSLEPTLRPSVGGVWGVLRSWARDAARSERCRGSFRSAPNARGCYPATRVCCHGRSRQSCRFDDADLRRRISSRSNSARPPSTVSMSLPCAVVVSAQASLRDRKPAFDSAMDASRVDHE